MIRVATPADVPAVVAAYDWLFAPPGGPVEGWDPATAADRLHAALANDRATVIVQQLVPGTGCSTIAGFVTVYLDILSVRFGQRAWVEDLAVDPEQRSFGIGKALLDAARKWAGEHGATHLELDSGDAREAAHRFYYREQPVWTARSFGYRVV
jgi:GNAT superfamily N-acetyltransferase